MLPHYVRGHNRADAGRAVSQINSAPTKKSQSFRLDDLIAAKERELTKITRYKQSLYLTSSAGLPSTLKSTVQETPP